MCASDGCCSYRGALPSAHERVSSAVFFVTPHNQSSLSKPEILVQHGCQSARGFVPDVSDSRSNLDVKYENRT